MLGYASDQHASRPIRRRHACVLHAAGGAQHWRSPVTSRCHVQTPDAVLADITPAERVKYEGHFAKVKRAGGWVDSKAAKQFFTKAGLPVSAAGTRVATRIAVYA